jgi:predicted nucleic acid-binding protein
MQASSGKGREELFYPFDTNEPKKQKIAHKLISEALNGSGIISHQVIQEFVSVASTKFKKPFTLPQLCMYMEEVLFSLWRVSPSRESYITACEVQERYKLSWWDALIVASAIEAQADCIYTEDLQHGQSFGSVLVVNPFI